MRELPEGWEIVKIRDIATVEKNVATPESLNGNSQKFIGLENIERESGRLVNFSEISGDELRSTKFKFTPEHILYGKLRPYLNKVFLPDFEGVCSTDILTIKPHSKRVLRKFLELVLKGSDFVDYATTRSIGANLPRVSPSTVLDYSFALPPLPVQRQIVAVLEQAEAVKRQRQEADALTGALLQSVFYEMFGDPENNERGWDYAQLEGLCSVITDGEHVTPRRTNSGIFLLSARNIQNHYISTSNVDFIDEEEYTRLSKHLIPKNGDVLVSCSGSVGRVTRVNVDYKFQLVRSVALMRPIVEKVDPIYLEYSFETQFMKKQLSSCVHQSSQANLFQGMIRKLKIPLPPLALQQQFARIVQDVERIREQQVASGREIEGLCEGLMQRAFAGELTA
ncbi:MAG: restriction endonuclease subunit S [Methanoregula sp.]